MTSIRTKKTSKTIKILKKLMIIILMKGRKSSERLALKREIHLIKDIVTGEDQRGGGKNVAPKDKKSESHLKLKSVTRVDKNQVISHEENNTITNA